MATLLTERIRRAGIGNGQGGFRWACPPMVKFGRVSVLGAESVGDPVGPPARRPGSEIGNNKRWAVGSYGMNGHRARDAPGPEAVYRITR